MGDTTGGEPGAPDLDDAPTTAQLQEAAVRGTVWTALQASAGVPLAVIANVFVARALGPKEFGVMATLLVAYSLATTVANMGVSDATIQWGSGAYARGRQSELIELLRRSSGYHL